jgi:hypothetical protein
MGEAPACGSERETQAGAAFLRGGSARDLRCRRVPDINAFTTATGNRAMHNHHQARWVSKQRLSELRKSGELSRGLLLDSYNGWIIIEPAESELGDGDILSAETADYELSPVWCPGSKAKLKEARKLLGLSAELEPGLVSAS